MKVQKLFFFALILAAISGFSQIEKINGISFVASSKEITSIDVNPVKKVNANYVALMPFGFIRDLRTPTITFNSSRQWFGETKLGLIQYAKEFQKNNIQIMVKPQIWVWDGQYTGFIEMTNEEEWKVLENSYSEFILTYAKAAQELNIPIFCIGTELEKFVINRTAYWQQLINRIRKIYKGKLTYAANWDEFKRVPFWKQLDYIGIDAYFPLSEISTPTVSDFEKGWQPHKVVIEAIQKSVEKPVMFTEFGYRSINFTGKEPWDAKRVEGNVNLEAQANGLQAIYNQFWEEEWFAGGFVWKWFHNHNKVGGKNDNRFTPQNKLSEQLLQQLYKQ